MSDKLQRRVEENRQKVEAEINENISAAHSAKQQQTAWMVLGGIGVVNHLAKGFNAQTIRGLQRVRDEKLFVPLGFSRFDDFLDEFEYSPMSYRQFNDREKMLLAEGDEVFDLLNNLRISHRQRRLLGAGNVQIDEDAGTVIIKTGDDESEEEIELNDRTRLLQTLSALADQASQLNATSAKQQEKIQKGEKEVENLRRQLDDAKKRPGETRISDLAISVCNTLELMARMAESADELELSHGNLYLESIRNSFEKTTAALRKPLAEMSDGEREKYLARKLKNFTADDDLADLTAKLDDADLADLMD